ncbi:tyrosinase family oxidase copper chaperone [Paractinoplanes atraurantiacus]|nr:tyrosinase family oxidase copper chaperone [Actinoplanes atraurantiacus]
MGRAVAGLGVAAAALSVAGSVSAAPAGAPRVPAQPAASPSYGTGFFEVYHGHHIMGWGHDRSACAYIDGMQLVLYAAGAGQYTSALQAFQPERGVRAITRASVRALGKYHMAPPRDVVAHCPRFATGAQHS